MAFSAAVEQCHCRTTHPCNRRRWINQPISWASPQGVMVVGHLVICSAGGGQSLFPVVFPLGSWRREPSYTPASVPPQLLALCVLITSLKHLMSRLAQVHRGESLRLWLTAS